jgi:hypothetical protein
VYTVSNVSGTNTFTVNGDVSAATRVYSVGFTPTVKDADASNENLSVRNFAVYGKFKSRVGQNISKTDLSFNVDKYGNAITLFGIILFKLVTRFIISLVPFSKINISPKFDDIFCPQILSNH